MKRVSGQTSGGKVTYGTGSDPRCATQVKDPESRTISKFSSNPFKDGGAQEQGDRTHKAGADKEPGPAGGRKLKAQPVTDKVTDKEVGRRFGQAVGKSGVDPDR